MKKLSVLLIVCLGLMFGAVVLAQDGTLNVGDITGDTAPYYGQRVTVQGNVDELVNIRSFILGEGGLTNPQLLVLNNSGQEFNIGLTKDADVMVTGTIYPSYSEGGWDQVMGLPAGEPINQGAGVDTTTGAEMTVTNAVESPAEAAVTEVATGAQNMEPMATEAIGDMNQTGMNQTDMNQAGMNQMQGVGLSEYPVVVISDRFPEHTILVVDSMDDIVFVNPDNQ